MGFDGRSLISSFQKHFESPRTDYGEQAAPPRAMTPANLTRPVYCVLGIPVDAISLSIALERIEAAAVSREFLLISTPNLNFVVNSLTDVEFKETLLDSDLCPPDGMPIIWLGRLLGLPINERVAGADILDRLQSRGEQAHNIRTFLFGGADGVADAAAETLNRRASGLSCVGTMNPGFGSVSEMSRDSIIDAVNSSGADFLIVSLGAKKGQLWLRRNHEKLKIPIRAHLGAAINFQAGTVKRAPATLRACGFEWLWRIKEERYLWRRYRDDGLVFLRLLLTRILPLLVTTQWQLIRTRYLPRGLLIETRHFDHYVTISLRGKATEDQVGKALSCFTEALAAQKDIIINLCDTNLVDARFLGLLLMLRKELKNRGARLKFTALSHAIERIFRLNELGFLLAENEPNSGYHDGDRNDTGEPFNA
jgi:N-acetylglucosaminyldiphosphoundecaprenol N-acetyl-beta-D-mannosaminyltransferase